MKITRRFAVASLLVIAVAIVLGAPAPASAGANGVKGANKTQVKLYPAADSPFPHATGTLTVYPSSTMGSYDAVSISVSKLAPNASYYMPVTVQQRGWPYGTYVFNVPIQTDARGNGRGGFSASPAYLIPLQSFQAYDASGTVVLTSNP